MGQDPPYIDSFMLITCPLCRQPLQQEERRWHCDNNHSFDIAKQGYTNLLPVQNKKSKSPGDDANMVMARNQFLDGGYYQPLSTAINQLILKHLIKRPSATVIDAGCGEGYYSSHLRRAIKSMNIDCDMAAMDISKFALRAAAKRDKAIQWFVANSNALPVADHLCDALLCLFAPLQAKEFHRCLREDGQLLVASTGKNHLIELRELLYDDVRDSVFDPGIAIEDYFEPTSSTSVNFTLDLPDSATINNLFAMTPHYWRVSPERKTILQDLDHLCVSVDIQLHCFSPRSISC